MLIGACDVNGFVLPSCELVEREHSDMDSDAEWGTVDMAHFKQYIEECIVLVLG
jgi:hypothetical protein